ncbi:hypothetical protein [Hamadaea tsunoensis]|uniref:hypothetical protein n=1 Tax=Hamadaea tsunoensis TaxID=53368 RepID=UPI00040E9BC7|nr:hypothetical protein [Hamadaea tsunoensis]
MSQGRDPSCPFCYNEIVGGALWFVCGGVGSPGRNGCAFGPDAERERLTGLNFQSRPAFKAPPTRRLGKALMRASCPHCGGATGQRCCPHCHCPLSSHFGTSTSPLIAMVGAKGTGKTVYLTVLARELLTKLWRQFKADIRLSGDSQGAQGTRQWLDRNINHVYADRRLFPKTPRAERGRKQPVVFEWRQEGDGFRFKREKVFETTFLSFYDTAGEDLLTLQSVHDQTYIGSADALILLIDPFTLPKARDFISLPDEAITTEDSTDDIIGLVTESLRSSHGSRTEGRISIPIAVTFTKMDAVLESLPEDHFLRRTPPQDGHYDESFGLETHEQIRSLLQKWGGEKIDNHFDKNYKTYRYFGVSALGAKPDYTQSKVNQSGVQPFRVEEPLIWLLSRFNVVKRRPRA